MNREKLVEIPQGTTKAGKLEELDDDEPLSNPKAYWRPSKKTSKNSVKLKRKWEKKRESARVQEKNERRKEEKSRREERGISAIWPFVQFHQTFCNEQGFLQYKMLRIFHRI